MGVDSVLFVTTAQLCDSLYMKAQKQHVYRKTLRNTVGTTKQLINSVLIKGAAVLNSLLRVVEVPPSFPPEILT